MFDSVDNFKLPTQLKTQQGKLRRVGFELEFTGLTIQQVAAVLQAQLGGQIREKSIAETVLEVADLGEFSIELDWNYLKQKAAEKNGAEPSQWLELLSQSAALIVPLEVVCPPLPLNELGRLNPVIDRLRQAGASGTKDSMIAAFGVHVNVEVPRFDATTLLAFLRAFGLLQWWLVDNHNVDLTRKLTPYVDLYPESYLRILFGYVEPDLDQLCDDYLHYNASRNRALDMLPLFALHAAGKVQAAIPDDRIKSRPTFHYRLPDCHIEQPDWSLATAWNSWWLIEQLAARQMDLDTLAARFLQMERPLLGVSRNDWTEVINLWLHDHALV